MPLSPRSRSRNLEEGSSSTPPRVSTSDLLAQLSTSPDPGIERPGLLRDEVMSSPWVPLPDTPGPEPQEVHTPSPVLPVIVQPGMPVQHENLGELLVELGVHENLGELLADLGVPANPSPGDIDRIRDLVNQQPQLLLRLFSARGEVWLRLECDPEDQHAIETAFGDAPISEAQLALMQHLIEAHADRVLVAEPDAPAFTLEMDIERQNPPLGSEIQTWSAYAGVGISPLDHFDHEENAAPFARVLGRLREETFWTTGETSERTLAQVTSVLRAIAQDASLRSEVFSLAQDELGSCHDNLLEGFSKIVLAVDNHRMVQAIENGTVDAKQLDDWAGSLFRLSLLESHMHRFIQDALLPSNTAISAAHREALTDEPLETMLHAKVVLRESLDLPESTASTMRYQEYSVLGPPELMLLEEQVRSSEKKPVERSAFLLGNETWRAGMKALYPQEFQDLKTRQDTADFYSELPPPDTDLAAQAEYVENALNLQKQHAEEENALLLRLAGVEPAA